MKKIIRFVSKIKAYFQKDLNELNSQFVKSVVPDTTTNKKIDLGRSDKKMIKFWLFFLLVGGIGYFMYNNSKFIFMIIAAYIVSMIVESLILFFQSLGLKRSLSIFLSYLIFILILFLVFLIVLPFLVSQITTLITIGLNYLMGIQQGLTVEGIDETIVNMRYLPDYWKTYFMDSFGNEQFWIQVQGALQQNITDIVSMGKTYISKVWFTVIGFVSGFTTFLWNFIIFIALSILFSAEKKSIMRFFSRIVGSQKQDFVYNKLDKIYKRLGIWLKARLVLSVFMAVSLFTALRIINLFGIAIENKISLSLVFGIFDVIPFIGPVIGSTPAVIGALTSGGILGGIVVVIVAILLNVIENVVLIPVLMGKRLGMNSVIVFMAIIFGGMLMGLLGVFLAVPIAVIITLLLEEEKGISLEVEDKKENKLNGVFGKSEK